VDRMNTHNRPCQRDWVLTRWARLRPAHEPKACTLQSNVRKTLKVYERD
jgi:hypothetical protein